VVAWLGPGKEGGSDVFAMRVDEEGSPVGNETKINVYGESDQSPTSVEALPAAGCLLAWGSNGQDGSGATVVYRRFNASLGSATAEILPHTYMQGAQTGGRVAAFSDGGYVVVWASDGIDGDQRGVFAQRFDSLDNRLYH